MKIHISKTLFVGLMLGTLSLGVPFYAHAVQNPTIACTPLSEEDGYSAKLTINGNRSEKNFKGIAEIVVIQDGITLVNEELEIHGTVETKFEHRYLLRSMARPDLLINIEIDSEQSLVSNLILEEIPSRLGGLSVSCKYQ